MNAWRIAGLSLTAVIGVALLWLLGPVLTPFLIAAALAYLFDPMVERLNAWKLPRTLSVLVVMLLMMLMVTVFFLLVIPLMRHEFVLVIERLPAATEWFDKTALPWVVSTFHIDSDKLNLAYIRETFTDYIPAAGDVLKTIAGKVGQGGMAIISLAVNLVMIPVVFFFLLRDWPQIKVGTNNLLPPRWRLVLTPLVHECDSALSEFLRGQLMVMLALAIVYTVGLWMVGLDIALLVGVFAGLASFIPYLGFALGLVLAVVGALLQFADPVMALWVIGVFAVGQVLEGAVFQPLLLGDRIGLHPVAVIFAILAGGQLFGFVGILLALPVAAILLVLLRHALRRYQQSHFYNGDVKTPPAAIETPGDIT